MFNRTVSSKFKPNGLLKWINNYLNKDAAFRCPLKSVLESKNGQSWFLHEWKKFAASRVHDGVKGTELKEERLIKRDKETGRVRTVKLLVYLSEFMNGCHFALEIKKKQTGHWLLFFNHSTMCSPTSSCNVTFQKCFLWLPLALTWVPGLNFSTELTNVVNYHSWYLCSKNKYIIMIELFLKIIIYI